METWFYKSIVATLSVTPTFIAIPFFKARGIDPLIFLVWYFLGSAAGVAAFTAAGGNAETLIPSIAPLLAIFVIGLTCMNALPLFKHPVDQELVPKSAVDFINEQGFKHPILNEFGTGGYLMYRYSNERGEPAYKVAIDGRTNVNPPEIWDLYRASFLGKANWQDYINRVQAETILWRQGTAMTALLLLSPEWCRVFASGSEDESFVVFIKRAEFDAKRDRLSSIDCS